MMSDKTAPDQFTSAVDRLRETVKWLVTIFAAIGAVLTAGLQFSNIGKLEAPPFFEELEEYRLIIAILAAAIALLSIVTIIWFALRVLVNEPVSLPALARQEANGQQGPHLAFAKEAGLLAKYRTLTELLNKSDVDITTRENVETDLKRLEQSNEAGKDEAIRQHKEQLVSLNNDIAYSAQVFSQIAAGIRYNQVYQRFKVTGKVLLIASLLAALAIGTFSWAVNPPDSATAAPLFRTPVEASVQLTEQGQLLFTETLGQGCVSSAIRVVVLGVSDGRYDVVSLPTNQCALARFIIDAEVGTVQPSQPVTLSK
jgi:hypothetical protein